MVRGATTLEAVRDAVPLDNQVRIPWPKRKAAPKRSRPTRAPREPANPRAGRGADCGPHGRVQLFRSAPKRCKAQLPAGSHALGATSSSIASAGRTSKPAPTKSPMRPRKTLGLLGLGEGRPWPSWRKGPVVEVSISVRERTAQLASPAAAVGVFDQQRDQADARRPRTSSWCVIWRSGAEQALAEAGVGCVHRGRPRQRSRKSFDFEPEFKLVQHSFSGRADSGRAEFRIPRWPTSARNCSSCPPDVIHLSSVDIRMARQLIAEETNPESPTPTK